MGSTSEKMVAGGQALRTPSAKGHVRQRPRLGFIVEERFDEVVGQHVLGVDCVACFVVSEAPEKRNTPSVPEGSSHLESAISRRSGAAEHMRARLAGPGDTHASTGYRLLILARTLSRACSRHGSMQ